ncbi:serine hydrolase domain-containing protein [Saccharothrix lopnurensis]|uniref:Serine hydrolase domain-containing protein n=1 Tax=Saccharothrix lopnurensis TaxID=1670621 RepID=A0ABW1NY16_9PSEU
MESLRVVSSWPVSTAAAAVVRADGEVLGTHGPVDHRFPLASVTKPLAAYAVLVAVEEGAVEWDRPAGPATIRHLVAHASGLAFDSDDVLAAPGRSRIYSNTGFEVLAGAVEEATGIPFAEYLRQAVFEPLGMTSSSLDGSAAAAATSTVSDLVRFAAEVQAPKLVSAELVAEATSVVFPGLRGVLPGFGSQEHNDWGLGFEVKADKSPHWTGASCSPRTFGHFGQKGTFLWVDPDPGVACVVLTDRNFSQWAVEAWPPFSDGVLAEVAGT